ncbi:MAG: LptA/OstA family protein [Vicinamibacterales bacterium]
MKWQRRARLGVGIFAVGFGALVYFAMGDRPTAPPSAPVERLDPRAIAETRGGDIIQVKGGERDVRVEFAGQVTYEDGQSVLKGLKAIIDNRAGRTFTITGNEGQIGPDLSNIDIVGDVTLTASDGLVATSTEAHYVDAEGIVRAPGPLEFTSGRLGGSGVGFTYDRQRDTLWLLDDAVITMAPEGESGGLSVSADKAGFARADRYMRFEGGVHLERDGQVVDADEATVHLFADRDEPERIELRGNARISGAAGVGSLRGMQARDITLAYAEDGRTLQQATLAGTASIDLAGGEGAPGQQLAAEWIDVSLADDGAVTSLVGRDAVEVGLPAADGAPARTIRSRELAGNGEPGQGLTTMHFDGGVEFRERGEGGGRIARADRLDVGLAGTGGALGDATFTGRFRFTDGPLSATSARAVYAVDKGTLALAGQAGTPPHVEDARMRIDAETIDVTLDPLTLVASGTVRSVLQPGARAEGDAPTLLAGSGVVNVIADDLTFEDATGTVTSKGGARLWQGDTSIQADAITMSDDKGDLSATGKVVAALLLGEAAEGGPRPKPTIGRGGTFTYAHAKRQALFETAAQLNGPEGDLSADRIQVVLGQADNSVAGLDARGAVRVSVDGREAKGARMHYDPKDARYQLSGTPVSLVEECRETTGRTLTFFRGSDRILIDGNEETRTQTKGGGKCPGTRFD